ncbi:hypothetical protein ACLMJK_006068 [Lecanora helva]
MARPQLVLYIDVISPFAYLAFHVVRTSAAFKQCDITYVPVFLGGIMKACGNTPPIQIKNKSDYTGKERMRYAKLFDVPMAEEMPPGFPRNTIQVQRVLSSIAVLYPERLGDTIATLYYLSFAERQEISTPESLRPILSQIFGDKSNDILVKAWATSTEIKNLLAAKTDEALAQGAFGLPWYAATNAEGEKEYFWGFDHIAQVTDHLGLSRPAAGKSAKGWKALL